VTDIKTAGSHMVMLLDLHGLSGLFTCKYYKYIFIHFILDYFNRILDARLGIYEKVLYGSGNLGYENR
jgi:hypothetical protein